MLNVPLLKYLFLAIFIISPSQTFAVNKDSDRRCREWAEMGECENNPNYMRRECQSSCEWYENKMGIENNAEIEEIKSFFELSAKDIDGNEFQFQNLEGKITVIVNVASRCGYTESHYRGLKELYDSVKSTESVEILAFPCNQFGRQEPGTCKEIKRFATQEKGAEYRLMDKIDVNGPNAHKVYKFLKREAGPPSISWNFATYFVVSPMGVVRSYSGVQPMDLQKLIMEMLEKDL